MPILATLPYTAGRYGGEFVGQKPVVGFLDLDFGIVNPFTKSDRRRVEKILDTVGPLIFPGQAKFAPGGQIYIGNVARYFILS